MMDLQKKPHEKIKLVEINPHLTCFLCKGYYIDATTISECLHSFCRSCIIKFLHERSYCPICEVIINKAKPNLKLDKTLQDIVYKLVPELFLNEMRKRQQFYQCHPDLAAKVTPEERGEDTERTIFNPRDKISLSIEYISDDSTPGAILIPQLIDKGVDVNNKKRNQAADNEESSPIRRFLQCPGMCRVDVLKKFIQNKYNVDTSQYYIDILYKRVPLPDHYTLIDIAYIYSWKRNEPMKFFFKITDVNLVNESLDYLMPPPPPILIHEPIKHEKPVKVANVEKKLARAVVKTAMPSESDDKKLLNDKKAEKLEVPKEVTVKKKETNGVKTVVKPNIEKSKEYTNITLDRSNNVEIITKIQKVSNKNGLQIGIKITKQTVKKPANHRPNGIKTESAILPEIKPIVPEIDAEKSNFLKSIELTAKNTISPPKVEPPPKPAQHKKHPAPKRKSSSPLKAEKPKKPRKFVNIQPKTAQNPSVMQMLKQNASNLSKIVDQMTPKPPKSDLQALLFDSYKINIPASLSVTVKNEKDGPSSIQKPVQNYIEILKIPDAPPSPAVTPSPQAKPPDSNENSKLLLDRLNSSVEVNKIEVKVEDVDKETEAELVTVDTTSINQEEPPDSKDKGRSSPTKNLPPSLQVSTTTIPKNPPQPKTPTCLPSPAYLPCKVTNMPTRDNFIKLNPRTPQTFQKMFEEAIKKPEFSNKFQTLPSVAKTETKKSPPSVSNDTTPPAKKNILEIASKLYKKTKMEQEKCDKKEPLNVPRVPQHKKRKAHDRGNPPLKDFNSYISSKVQAQSQTQTVTSLHSPSLGLNYTVSVSQASNPPKSPKPKTEVDIPSPSTPTTLNIPRKYSTSPKPRPSSPQPKASPTKKTQSPAGSKLNLNVVTTTHSENNQPLSPNQILEKYNIQNLAQLTANFNFPSNLCTANQLAAIHQAMIYRHFEMQNHQNWLNMNPGPLMQYEKYLKSLSKS